MLLKKRLMNRSHQDNSPIYRSAHNTLTSTPSLAFASTGLLALLVSASTLQSKPANASAAESQTQIEQLITTEQRFTGEQLLDRIIITVNDDVILQSDLNHRVEEIIPQLQIQKAAPPANILVKQILDRLVLEKIQLQMADQMGIRVSDNELNESIKTIARQNQLNLNRFQEELSKQGLTYVTFREQIRRDMILSQVQKRRIGSRIQVSEQDALTFLSSPLGKEQLAADYRIHHILLAVDDNNPEKSASKVEAQANTLYEQLQKKPNEFPQIAAQHSDSQTALEGGDLGWRPVKELPTLFADRAISMKVGEISEPIKSASGFHIIRLTERRGKTEKIIQQLKVRHILIKPNEIRSNLAAEQLIQEIRNRLVAGESFKALAQTYSDDTGSARSGGDLGWVSPGQMVPEFERVMNRSAKEAISAPFETQFGWHILQVTDNRTEDFSDEFRLNQAKNFVFKRKFEEELPIWLREIRQEAFVEQKLTVEELAASVNTLN